MVFGCALGQTFSICWIMFPADLKNLDLWKQKMFRHRLPRNVSETQKLKVYQKWPFVFVTQHQYAMKNEPGQCLFYYYFSDRRSQNKSVGTT